jgi:RHS repeat-associated protein
VQRYRFDAWGNFVAPVTISIPNDSLGGSHGDSLQPPPNNKGGAAELTFPITARGFTGHEHYPEFKIINMNARLYDPVIARFFSPDNYVLDNETTQDFNRYSYARNNPLKYTDPTGNLYNPIYDREGNHLGNTSEGFTGKVLIYSGKDEINWSSMNVTEACKLDGVTTYDVIRSNLTNDTKSKIWTNIASYFEGMSVFDLKFTMKDMLDEKIHFGGTGNWSSKWKDGAGWGKIYGSDSYGGSYETTVENVASSIISHEWYSHIKKEHHEDLKSHRLAYKNVINNKTLWENTTDAYKEYNLKTLKKLTTDETGRLNVDKPYLNLYKKYVP